MQLIQIRFRDGNITKETIDELFADIKANSGDRLTDDDKTGFLIGIRALERMVNTVWMEILEGPATPDGKTGLEFLLDRVQLTDIRTAP